MISKRAKTDRIEMTVKMQVTESQALALQAMFEYWNVLASMGSSRDVGFYCDGDGNFKPECNISFSETITTLTDEMRKIAVREERDGNRVYDFDSIAWLLHK
jgi:threonine aldolase